MFLPSIYFQQKYFCLSNIGFKRLMHNKIHQLQIRSVTMTVCSLNMWMIGFITNYGYAFLLEAINLHGCSMVFNGACFALALFTWTVIPETKGKSNEEIQQLLEK